MSSDRNEKIRTGLRVVTRKGVHIDVRRAALKFAAWLRLHYDFPIRVTVYLYAVERLHSPPDEDIVSIFFQPREKNKEPLIYLATGDYEELVSEKGNIDDPLCSIVVTELAQHVINYQNWWFNHSWSKSKRTNRWEALVREYATDVKDII
jgi:hypothetical protein